MKLILPNSSANNVIHRKQSNPVCKPNPYVLNYMSVHKVEEQNFAR